jgi:hypothetical protein
MGPQWAAVRMVFIEVVKACAPGLPVAGFTAFFEAVYGLTQISELSPEFSA